MLRFAIGSGLRFVLRSRRRAVDYAVISAVEVKIWQNPFRMCKSFMDEADN